MRPRQGLSLESWSILGTDSQVAIKDLSLESRSCWVSDQGLINSPGSSLESGFELESNQCSILSRVDDHVQNHGSKIGFGTHVGD